jgi:hypothetical protein
MGFLEGLDSTSAFVVLMLFDYLIAFPCVCILWYLFMSGRQFGHPSSDGYRGAL